MGRAAIRRAVPGSIPVKVLRNLPMTYSSRLRTVALGPTQPLAEMSAKKFHWGYSAVGARADNSDVLIMPNVKEGS